MTIKKLSENKVFGGSHSRYQHESDALNCPMHFAVFVPSSAKPESPAPVLYWLSGLTCTDENFMQKAGVFRKAEELGLVIVAPDTSPRGDNVANDEAYDLGQGAGFYLNATQEPWSEHFQMYDYITSELPQLVREHCPVSEKMAISGHSMGGHGALTIGIKNQDKYSSVSAFSPISNPCNCPWGHKAFSAYLGGDKEKWKNYDACELITSKGMGLPVLVDQGDADNFLDEQLKPEALTSAAEKNSVDLKLRMQPGYDHSYFFISSFIEDHLVFHKTHLDK